MDVDGVLRWLVFRRLDGKSLAAACCVSRDWAKAASDEDLWKPLACEKWPSLSTQAGNRLLESFGRSYRHFYCERSKAARFRSRPPPDLQVFDLSILLDITFNGDTIASVIRGGDEIVPMYPPDSWEGSMFRFKLEMTKADVRKKTELVRGSSLGLGAVAPSTSRVERCRSGEVSGRDGDGLQKLRRCDIKKFEVTWAVMMQGSSKIVQILHARGGTFVDNVCSFTGRLPRILGYPSTASNLMAEVDLVFESPSASETHGNRTFPRYSTFTEARISVINEDSWRYISHNEALGYLQHLLQNHE